MIVFGAFILIVSQTTAHWKLQLQIYPIMSVWSLPTQEWGGLGLQPFKWLEIIGPIALWARKGFSVFNTACSLTCLNDFFCTTNLWPTPIQLPSVSQVSPGRSIDGKGGDISLHRRALMPKQYRKKSVKGSEKKCKKVILPGGRKGLSSFSCINPELDSKSLILSQPVLTDTEQHAIFLHTCSACPPSQPCYPPELLDCLFIVIATVGRASHTWRLRSISAIARMSEHRWRGLAGRRSHTMPRSPLFFFCIF